MAKTDPAGREYGPSAHVFGLLGEPVASIKKAWETAVLRAYGHEAAYDEAGKLSPAARTALATIDLHFHDLRHEAGSRWLEAGMPLHHVKEILGHANISQTDTYPNAGRVALKDSMKQFDAFRGKTVAKGEATEQRPLGHESEDATQKGQLH
jgi:integrase